MAEHKLSHEKDSFTPGPHSYLTSPAYADDGSNSTENHNGTLNSSMVVENHLNRSYYLDNYGELLSEALSKNREIRSSLYARYKRTGDRRYYVAYVDAGYAVGVFQRIKSRRPLTSYEKIIEIQTIQANNAYYSQRLSPSKSYVAIVFGNRSSYYMNFPSEYRSSLPFSYYKYRGWNIYPVATSNLAGAVNESMFLEILDEQKLMVTFRTCRGMRYAVFPMYFDYCGSGTGWLDSFAQGNLAGHYARAYRLTGNREYLEISDALINSFRAPAGLVKSTKYGNFYLHYNFMRQHYILNAHLICTLGFQRAYTCTGNPGALLLFRDGVSTFRAMHRRFDSGRWTYYAVDGGSYRPAWLASEGYHRLHVQLANSLWRATGDSYYRRIAVRWNSYLKMKGLKPERL